MIEWEEVSLSNVADYAKDKIEAKVLDASNFISTENMLVDRAGITSSSYVPGNGKVCGFKKNDVLVSNIRPYFKKIWFADKPGGCSNDVIVFRSKSNVDPKYLYYQLSQNEFFDFMMTGANGTKMPRGNRNSIPHYRFLLPSLNIQRSIASILSSYDDLIENNLQRIKLLEELAQRTYEEWFVKFRINGEDLVIDKATGLPVGWERKRLGEIAVVNRSNLKKGFSDKIKYVDISSVSTGVIDSYIEYEFDEAPGRARRIVRHGDIIWSCVRPNRRSYSHVCNPIENLIVSTGFAVITPTSIPTSYLYQYVTTGSFVGYLTNLAGGVAYPAVTSNVFEDAEVVIPTTSLVKNYDKIFNPALEAISNYRNQNQLLTQSRDILLPRLMNGTISIAEAEESLAKAAETKEIY